MKILSRLLVALALVICGILCIPTGSSISGISPAQAFPHHGNGAAVTPPPVTNWVTAYYQSFTNGFNHAGSINVFPSGWWLSYAAQGSGHVISPYTNNATAAVGLGSPIFLADNNFPASFGVDNGDAAACKAAVGCVMIGSGGTDPNSNVTTSSVQSQLNAYSSVSASANNGGYWGIDEPGQTTACDTSTLNPPGPGLGGVAAYIGLIHGKDATRWAVTNQAQMPWYYTKTIQIPCVSSVGGAIALPWYNAAFVASDIPSFDAYSCIDGNAFQQQELYAFDHVQNTDGATHGTDCEFAEGVGVAIGQSLLAAAGVNKPQFAFIAPLTNALTHNYTATNNGFGFKMTAGSDVIQVSTSYNANSPGVIFTNQLWKTPPGGSALGITQSAGTPCFTGTIHITNIIDATHADTDVNTTTNGTCNWTGGGGSSDVFVTVAGGTANSGGWCNASLNLCPSGNMIRDTVASGLGQVFEAIDNGALGIWWFGFDDCTNDPSFGFGNPSPGAGCTSVQTAAAANFVSYVNTTLTTLAPTINLPTDAACSMTDPHGTDASSCSNGGYTMTTGTATCPGVIIAKHDATFTYLHIISNRQSWSASNCGATAGGVMTISGLSAFNGHTVTVMYDTNDKVDPTNSQTGHTTTVSGGSVAFTLGANGDGYNHLTLKISLLGFAFPMYRRRKQKPANDDEVRDVA